LNHFTFPSDTKIPSFLFHDSEKRFYKVVSQAAPIFYPDVRLSTRSFNSLPTLTLQRYILSNPFRGQFPFPMGEISPMVFHLYP
jgi:hypothetical protein